MPSEFYILLGGMCFVACAILATFWVGKESGEDNAENDNYDKLIEANAKNIKTATEVKQEQDKPYNTESDPDKLLYKD